MEAITLQAMKTFPRIFFDKAILSLILHYLPQESVKLLKGCLKRAGVKERKKKVKEVVKLYINDFGKHQEKVKFRISENCGIVITTNIFNLKRDYLQQFSHIKHNNEIISLDKDDLFEYLRVLPKFEFVLANTTQLDGTVKEKDLLKLSKVIIPYDTDDNSESDEEDNKKKKYEMFYNEDNVSSLEKINFNDRDGLIERQKRILEQMNSDEVEIFYPLKFICGIKYWSIILCQGGYFACGFFLKDQLIDHKSDHKYVVRKKAGQRQITKDKAKKVKTSIGAQIRRANEKKHQENIEYILKLNEDHLAKSDAIFCQAPGVNKTILIGEDRPLTSYQTKIINIPFSVARANYTNLMEVYLKLIFVNLEINDEKIKKLFK